MRHQLVPPPTSSTSLSTATSSPSHIPLISRRSLEGRAYAGNGERETRDGRLIDACFDTPRMIGINRANGTLLIAEQHYIRHIPPDGSDHSFFLSVHHRS
jgi:hypothetical protein